MSEILDEAYQTRHLIGENCFLNPIIKFTRQKHYILSKFKAANEGL